MVQILFVCTGNTCRSSMAEVLARQWLTVNAGRRTDIRVTSAGLAAWPGSPASNNAVLAMNEAGIDLTGHKSSLFSKELAEQSDLILTMTTGHKHTVIDRYPECASKVFTLGEFALGAFGCDIIDPYGQPLEVYKACALKLRELTDAALHKILGQV